MAINGFPASIQNVIEQTLFLETKLRKGMRPKLVFRAAVSKRTPEWFDARIGETKTFTRSNPIAPNTTPQDPSTNTGLDNGITPATRGFEQWKAQLNKWIGGVDLNVLGDKTLLGSLFIDNMEELGASASNSIELVCANRVFQAYDTGDTFALAAVANAAAIHVDNGYGFDSQYATSVAPSYGLPQSLSSGNKIPILVISHTDGTVVDHANVTAAAFDGSNLSYMQSAGDQLGASAVLTLDRSITCSQYDRVVAMDRAASTSVFNPVYKDGAFVVRPLANGAMRGSAAEMTVGDIIVPSVSIPQAVALLKRRNAPPLRNGLYGCAIDSTILGQFFSDEGFQRATQGTWDRGNVFPDGIIAKGWGVEFIPATQVPVYQAPIGGFALRHAHVFGEDVVSEHPFIGAKDARSEAAKAGDIVDVRWVDHIEFISQAPLDRANEVVKMTYKYTGDFEPGTDKGSNPTSVRTSDYCRYKRGVTIQAASAF